VVRPLDQVTAALVSVGLGRGQTVPSPSAERGVGQGLWDG
jgi:hypothetical protein